MLSYHASLTVLPSQGRTQDLAAHEASELLETISHLAYSYFDNLQLYPLFLPPQHVNVLFIVTILTEFMVLFS